MAYVPSTTTMRDCPPLPECPECGGLECLCRPRFFAGQLLTDEDLKRLDRYITEKNKLHNRYLHGWGVVCGLDVVCSPCAGMVQVKSGYALSPCGADIIVCRDEPVDIGALIQQCRQVQKQPDCEPPRSVTSADCANLTEDWVLALCYYETTSRGVTPLKGGSPASGCGCQNSSTGKSAYQSSTRSVSSQCEPTLTCEGYTWRVYKAPTAQSASAGVLVDHFMACIKPFVQQFGQLTGLLNPPHDNEKLRQFCCSFKQTLKESLNGAGLYRCALAERLNNITCPDPKDTKIGENYLTVWKSAVQELVLVAGEFLRYCLCSALLPPCPESVYDDCVPLATVTVRQADYQIMSVCTWSARRIAVTLPALGYWLSGLQPFAAYWRHLLETLCCLPLQPKQFDFANATDTTGRLTDVPTFAGVRLSEPIQDLLKLFRDLPNNGDRAIDVQTLVLAILGFVDTQNQLFMSSPERDQPGQFLLLNQLVAPLLAEVDLLSKVGQLQPPAAAVSAQELTELREIVNSLQSTVAEQQKTITGLKSPQQRKK